MRDRAAAEKWNRRPVTAAQREEEWVESGLIRRFHEQAAHVRDNAHRLKAFDGMAEEARCRELAATAKVSGRPHYETEKE